ncbi:hypothetical protein Tco_0964264 [Tanacetum coccineum]
MMRFVLLHWDVNAALVASCPGYKEVVDYLIPLAKRRACSSVIAKIVFSASVYYIWQERNARLFSNQKRTITQLSEVIKSVVRLKLLSCSFKKTRAGLTFVRLWKLPESRFVSRVVCHFWLVVVQALLEVNVIKKVALDIVPGLIGLDDDSDTSFLAFSQLLGESKVFSIRKRVIWDNEGVSFFDDYDIDLKNCFANVRVDEEVNTHSCAQIAGTMDLIIEIVGSCDIENEKREVTHFACSDLRKCNVLYDRLLIVSGLSKNSKTAPDAELDIRWRLLSGKIAFDDTRILLFTDKGSNCLKGEGGTKTEPRWVEEERGIGVALVVSKVVVFGSAVDCGKKARPKLQVWLFLPRAVEEPYKGVNNGDECLISAVFVRDDVVVMSRL